MSARSLRTANILRTRRQRPALRRIRLTANILPTQKSLLVTGRCLRIVSTRLIRKSRHALDIPREADSTFTAAATMMRNSAQVIHVTDHPLDSRDLSRVIRTVECADRS